MPIPSLTNLSPAELLGTLNALIRQSNAAAATAQNAVNGPPLLAAIGDSITGNNTNYGIYTVTMSPVNNVSLLSGTVTGVSVGQTGNCLLNTEGPAVWAAAFTYQGWQLPPTYVFGAPAQTVDVVYQTMLPLLLAAPQLPRACIVECGTNNIVQSDGSQTFSYITQYLGLIYAALLAAGVQVIAVPIGPRSDVAITGLTAANQVTAAATAEQVNNWIRDMTKTTPGLFMADVNVALASPTSVIMDIVTNTTIGTNTNIAPLYRQDYLHPSCGGSFLKGYSIAKILETIQPNIPLYIPNNSRQYLASIAGANQNDNLIANSLFAVTGTPTTNGAGASGITGTGPTTGWTIGNTDTGTAIACSIVKSLVNPNWPANLLQMVFSGTYSMPAQVSPVLAATTLANYARVYTSVSIANAGLAAGQTVEGYFYVEIPPQAFNGICGIALQIGGGGGTTYNYGMYPNFNSLPINTSSPTISFVVKCPGYTITAADVTNGFLNARIYLFYTVAGTVAYATAPIAATIKLGLVRVQLVH